jgi:hypothetical protein
MRTIHSEPLEIQTSAPRHTRMRVRLSHIHANTHEQATASGGVRALVSLIHRASGKSTVYVGGGAQQATPFMDSGMQQSSPTVPGLQVTGALKQRPSHESDGAS